MTDKEILDKAIEKAMDNGWDYTNWEEKTDKLISNENNVCLMANYYHYPILMFSHEFAKAFWGEDERMTSTNGKYLKNYEYHLQQMVLEKEPLKYLEKFLDE